MISLPNVHYACNFNCVKALILYILLHMDDTIFNRAGQMRSLSFEAKLHGLKWYPDFTTDCCTVIPQFTNSIVHFFQIL